MGHGSRGEVAHDREGTTNQPHPHLRTRHLPAKNQPNQNQPTPTLERKQTIKTAYRGRRRQISSLRTTGRTSKLKILIMATKTRSKEPRKAQNTRGTAGDKPRKERARGSSATGNSEEGRTGTRRKGSEVVHARDDEPVLGPFAGVRTCTCCCGNTG
jgi:hypothetical protein